MAYVVINGLKTLIPIRMVISNVAQVYVMPQNAVKPKEVNGRMEDVVIGPPIPIRMVISNVAQIYVMPQNAVKAFGLTNGWMAYVVKVEVSHVVRPQDMNG